VLVVDDEPLFRWSLAETLRGGGHAVIEAATGAAALRACSEAPGPVDVVLLDYELPDVRDASLLSTLHHRWPAIRVILMSAYLTPDMAREVVTLGASRAIAKPFDMGSVPALIRGASG
jgi:DNA-binding NtrC family response regulator